MNVALFCHTDRSDDGLPDAEAIVSPLVRHAPPDLAIQPYIGDWADGPRLLRAAVADRPALVHVHGVGSMTTWGLLAARCLGVPSLATWSGGPTSRIVDAWLHRVFRRCSSVLVPSTSMRDELVSCGYRHADIHVWQPGVDVDRFRPDCRSHEWRERWAVSDRRPAVLYVTSGAPRIRLDLLRAVLALLQDHGVSHQPVVVGTDAPAFGMLAKGEWPAILASMDLVIAGPSATDLGQLIVQAHACGVPVIVPDGPGVADLVESGVTGYVCRDDDPLEYAWRASLLLRDCERRRRCGEAAIRAAQRHAWTIAARPLYRLWRDVAAPRVPGNRRAANDVTECLPPAPGAS